jgi:protein-S-isoprenylcysteine O-methyltransferase Ste14
MPTDRIVNMVVGWAGKERSFFYKAVTMVIGAVLLLAVVPGALFLAGFAVEKHLLADWLVWLGTVIALLITLVGLLFLLWSVITLILAGKGTPAPAAPTRKLVVTGPYRLCRNPAQLGAMFYYLGLGIHFGSLAIGIIMFLLAFLIGSCYHKFVEEKELLRRFGSEYEEYRKNTPFLFPKF